MSTNTEQELSLDEISEISKGVQYHTKQIQQAKDTYETWLSSKGYRFVIEGNYHDTCHYAIHKSWLETYHKHGRYIIPKWAVIRLSEME